MPEPQASLQQKLLSSEGIALKGLTIDMKVYGWLPKRKPRNKPGKSTIKSTRKSNRHNSPKLRT